MRAQPLNRKSTYHGLIAGGSKNITWTSMENDPANSGAERKQRENLCLEFLWLSNWRFMAYKVTGYFKYMSINFGACKL